MRLNAGGAAFSLQEDLHGRRLFHTELTRRQLTECVRGAFGQGIRGGEFDRLTVTRDRSENPGELVAVTQPQLPCALRVEQQGLECLPELVTGERLVEPDQGADRLGRARGGGGAERGEAAPSGGGDDVGDRCGDERGGDPGVELAADRVRHHGLTVGHDAEDVPVLFGWNGSYRGVR